MKTNTFHYAFGKRIPGKINEPIISQFFHFGAVISYNDTFGFAVKHVFVITTVAGCNKLLQWNFPFIAEIPDSVAFAGSERKNIQVPILSQKYFCSQLVIVQEFVKISEVVLIKILIHVIT